MIRLARAATIALCLLLGAFSQAAAQMPRAGTLLENQAEASYFNADLGTLEVVRSNIVTVAVNVFPAIAVERDQFLRLPPDTLDRFQFQVTNTGNIELTPVLDVAQQTSDDYDLIDIAIHHDANANGQIDPGEGTVAMGDTMVFAPGQRRSFIVICRTPTGVSAGDRAIANFSANDAAEGVSGASQGEVIIVTSGLTLAKQASSGSIGPGDALTYTLRLRNNGSVDIPPFTELDGQTIQVDGAPASGVLVRDAIPLGTTFESIVDPVNLRPLYHLAGEARHSYRTTAPADLGDVDAVAFLHETAYPPGRSSDLVFTVTAQANTGGLTLENQARTWIPGTGGSPDEVPSNIVETNVGGAGGTLEFTDGLFSEDVTAIPGNANAFLQISAGLCNITPGADQVAIRLISTPDGDVETVIATETGPNTGVFRTGAVPVQDQSPAIHENSILSGSRNTDVGAEAVCQGQSLTDTLVVNAGGFVFDSVTNQGVAGVGVTLMSASGQEVARTTTGPGGFYQFTSLAPGDYRILVDPPAGMQFASDVSAFPGYGRDTDTAASYGETFTISAEQAQFGWDIPIDPTGERTLTLEKRGKKRTARLGETLRYEITVTNHGDLAILDAVIEDTLPRGFAYVQGSARLDGDSLADPAGAPGRRLTFDIERIARRGERTLVYLARVLATAGQGKRTNRAAARGALAGNGRAVASNIGRWTVEIDERGGVFSDAAVTLGKVYFDCNMNRRQDGPDEHGIPGVKIYLQSGRSVVTDGEGKYSLPDLRALTQVFSVLESTLPEGARVLRSRTRDALDASSRFVDLKKGQVRQEDFPVAPCTEETAADLEMRLERYKPADGAQSRFVTDLPLTAGRRRPISADEQGELATTTQIVSGADTGEWAMFTRPGDETAPKDVGVTRDLEAEIRGYAPDIGFVDLRDGDTVTRRTLSVRMKGPARGLLSLEVNGKTVPERQIGQKSVYATGGVQALEYVAVGLAPGENTLRAVMKDPFGNERGSRRITIRTPGEAHGIQIIAPELASADPNRPIPVVIRVVDAGGRLSATPVEVTLDARAGHWDVQDIRDGEAGLQTFIDRGEAVFHFIPPNLAGSHDLIVRSGYGVARKTIRLTPDMNEQVMVGLVEGAVRFGENGASLAPLMRSDGLSPFEKTAEGVRGALFLKGRIKGDALLTLRYESDKDTEARLFRDIRPDEFYPVYGDSSERGFEAHSSERLYVKVEKGLSYVLYGDIDISSRSEAVELAPYRRKFTGARAHGEYGAVTLDVFAGQIESERIVREIRARGVSGPYDIDLDGFVENSETVELVTRDRDQRDVVLKTVRLTRYTDYTLDFFGGTILFDSPIGSVDGNLDPVFIRVTYEADGDFEKYWIYGGEANVAVTEEVSIGYREVRADADDLTTQRRTVRSAFAEADFGPYGRAEVEVGHTENHVGETGWGARVSYEQRTENTQIKLEAGRTDAHYDVPGASIARAREEVRGKVRHRLGKTVTASAEGLYSRDIDPDADRQTRYGAETRLAWRINDQVEATVGGRYVTTERESERKSEDVASAILGMKWQPTWLPGAILHGEYEQDLLDDNHGRVLFGGEYQYSPDLRFYTETEVATSKTGMFGLGETDSNRVIAKAGLEYAWAEGITSFSEYRVSDRNIDGGAFDGAARGNLLQDSYSQGSLANGFRGSWQISETTLVRGRVEHVEPVGDDPHEHRNTAVAIGYSFQDKPAGILLETDLEWSQGENREGWYSGATIGKQHGDISFLLQNRFALDETASNQRVRDRLRVGAAWRPTDHNRWSALAWYGVELDMSEVSDHDEFTQSWSLGGEYRLTDDLRLRARHAGRHYTSEIDTIDTSSLLLLVSGGFEYDITDRLNVGLESTVFYDPENGTTQTGIGAEVGFALTDNVMASVGYNFADLEEEGIRDIYQEGFYVRMRAKLGSDAWNMFGAGGP